MNYQADDDDWETGDDFINYDTAREKKYKDVVILNNVQNELVRIYNSLILPISTLL